MRLGDETLPSLKGWRGRLRVPGTCIPVLAALAAVLSAASADETPGLPVWYSQVQVKPAAPPRLVGDLACASCHADKVASYHQTSHFKTSSWPSPATVHGPFGAGRNTMPTANPGLSFTMEARDGGFFVTAYLRTSATEVLSHCERIDVVVGSGRKGQTYLYWMGDRLFELPVSYWTGLDSWVNSPGYTDGQAVFDRPIVPRCLECHGSSFQQETPPVNRFGTSSLVLGIICEKCHGPGSEHVARFRSPSPPKSYEESAIINPARLSRARQLDVCGLCHHGAGRPLAPSLSFVPGAQLDQYLEFAKVAPDAPIDVHASQVQMLERSLCFRRTRTLTCFTCHDVHVAQRDAEAFAPKCLECHKVEGCRAFPRLGRAIAAKCIDCHMPLQQTAKIVSKLDGRSVQPKVRNHHIAIYPEESPP